MTRLSTPSLTLRSESARPAAIDGPRPDVQDVRNDFDAQFVVEWQVVDPWKPAVTVVQGTAV